MVRANPRRRRRAARKPVVRQRPVPIPRQMLSLSQCAISYAAATLDPWGKGYEVTDVCIPDSINWPSDRLRLRVSNATMTVNSSGCALATFNPFNMCADVDFGSTSGATSVGGTNTTISAWTLMNSVQWPSPFNDADIGAQKTQYRPVNFAVRVTYTGKPLDLSGLVCFLQSPNDQAIGGINSVTAQGYPGYRQFTTDKSSCYCASYKFVDRSFKSANTDGSHDGSPLFAVFITGAEPSTSYAIETYAWYEAIGRSVRGARPVEEDPTGYAAVQSAQNAIAWSGRKTSEGKRSFLDKVELAFKKTSRFVTKVEHFAEKAVPIVAGMAALAA